MNIKNVCMIDDDPELVDIIAEYLDILDVNTIKACSWDNVSIDILKSSDLIILDLKLPDFDGLDIIDFMTSAEVNTPIVLCTGQEESVAAAAADLLMTQGLTYAGKLLKPFALNSLKELLANLTGKEQLKSISFEKQHGKIVTILTKKQLIEAFENNCFSLHYQPQIFSHSARWYGVECLARLTMPEGKMIAPDIFIPALVEYDLIDDFTLFIFEMGLSQLANIKIPKQLKIAFNLSAQSINSEFLTQLFEYVKASPFAIGNIVLEITETEKFERSQNIKKLLTKLRLQGFMLSLDDFGTGYSTIQEIDSIPFNQIKVDKIFVQSMEDKKSSDVIVSNTISLGQKLGLTVVAEGVETEKQAKRIASLNCEVSQGYFYSRPLTIDDLANFCTLQHHRATS